MAHKTLVGGTDYEIKGGMTLVGGTDYGIKAGKTQIGGTDYDLAFGGAPVKTTVIVSGQFQSEDCYATINGEKYYALNTNVTVEVFAGDVITFGIFSRMLGVVPPQGKLTIDGETYLVAEGTSAGVDVKTYNWTIPNGISNINIVIVSAITNGVITVTTS